MPLAGLWPDKQCQLHITRVPLPCCRNTTLSDLVTSVADLIHYVGFISTVALRLENNSAFLMYFILEFYERVRKLFTFIPYDRGGGASEGGDGASAEDRS